MTGELTLMGKADSPCHASHREYSAKSAVHAQINVHPPFPPPRKWKGRGSIHQSVQSRVEFIFPPRWKPWARELEVLKVGGIKEKVRPKCQFSVSSALPLPRSLCLSLSLSLPLCLSHCKLRNKALRHMTGHSCASRGSENSLTPTAERGRKTLQPWYCKPRIADGPVYYYLLKNPLCYPS